MAHSYRCRRCGYDLSVIDVATCPECGLQWPHEPLTGPLAKRRGVPGWAVWLLIAAVVLTGLFGTLSIPAAVRGDAVAIVAVMMLLSGVAVGAIMLTRGGPARRR